MIFNIKNVAEIKNYLNHLARQGGSIEIKPYKPRRTLKQNRYLHLLLQILAIDLGETLEYTKQVVFKQIINKEIFEYERENPKTGEVSVRFRSTRDLDSTEMKRAIDRLIDYARVELNVSLPSQENNDSIEDMQVYVKNNNQYLF